MPEIDESDLQLKIRSLKVLAINTRDMLEKIEHTTIVLESIANAGDTDPVLGQAMSTARRQEIYDACIPVADELLGTEEDGVDDE